MPRVIALITGSAPDQSMCVCLEKLYSPAHILRVLHSIDMFLEWKHSANVGPWHAFMDLKYL